MCSEETWLRLLAGVVLAVANGADGGHERETIFEECADSSGLEGEE